MWLVVQNDERETKEERRKKTNLSSFVAFFARFAVR